MSGDSRLTHMCPQCLTEDEDEHGCAYLHRSHQIPGVTTCWKHETRLLDRCPSCNCPFAHPSQLILSAWLGCACGFLIAVHKQSGTELSSIHEKEFARFTRQLLIAGPVQLTTRQLITMYKQRAAECGYAWGGDRVNRKALFAKIEEFFGPVLLARMDPAYGKGKTSGWFHVLSPSACTETPLNRHLIISYFLFRDAEVFLTHAVAAAARLPPDDAAAGAGATLETVDASTEENRRSAELLDELLRIAQRSDYDTEQLWRYQFASMTRLVKLLPDACHVLNMRIRRAVAKKKRDAASALRIRERLAQHDAKWAAAISSIAHNVYSEDSRPVKVTMKRLVKAAGVPGVSWPSQSKYPLANLAVNAKAESTWHFYARRLLWTLQSLHPDTPDHLVIIHASLELYKAKAVLALFSDVVRGAGPSIKVVMAILSSRCITTNWEGPCPEQEFYKAGRAYRLRTSRRGPIGGRAGASHLTPERS